MELIAAYINKRKQKDFPNIIGRFLKTTVSAQSNIDLECHTQLRATETLMPQHAFGSPEKRIFLGILFDSQTDFDVFYKDFYLHHNYFNPHHLENDYWQATGIIENVQVESSSLFEDNEKLVLEVDFLVHEFAYKRGG